MTKTTANPRNLHRAKLMRPKTKKFLKLGPLRSCCPHAHHLLIRSHTTCKGTISDRTQIPKSTKTMTLRAMGTMRRRRMRTNLRPPKSPYNRLKVNSCPAQQPSSRLSVYSIMKSSSYSSRMRKMSIQLELWRS